MKTITKAQALRRARERQRALNTAEAAATDAAQRRDAALLAAKDAGATYAELQEATDLSTARVTQVLRRARQTTTD